MQEQNTTIEELSFNNEEQSSLDLRYIFFILMQKWWVIALCMAVFGIIAGMVSIFFLKPVYSASSTMYVYRKVETGTSVMSELSAGSQLVKDSVVLLKSEAVLDRALKMVGSDMKPAQLAANLNASTEKDTRILKITINHGNPEMAANLTNAVSDSFLEVFKNLTQANVRYSSPNEEYINIVDRAYSNPVPVKPDKKMNVLIALVLGAGVGVGIIFLIEFLDDTIRSPEVIKLHYNLDVMGVVPMFDQK